MLATTVSFPTARQLCSKAVCACSFRGTYP